MVSNRPPINNFSRQLSKTFGTNLNSLITVSISTTLMFHKFLSSLARSFFLLSLIFIVWYAETANFTIRQLHFFPIITRFGLLAGIRWSVYISKSQRNLRVSFHRTDSGFSMYPFVVWSNFNFLYSAQLILFAHRHVYSYTIYFPTFTYYVIKGFVSITKLSSRAILLLIIIIITILFGESFF